MLIILIIILLIINGYLPFLEDMLLVNIMTNFLPQILKIFLVINILILFINIIIIILNKKKDNKKKKDNVIKKWLYINSPIIIVLTIGLLFNINYLNKNENTEIDNGTYNIFYQNIYLPKTEDQVKEIYSNIGDSEVVAVIENSYEFHDYMVEKGWKRISGNIKTECAFYVKDGTEVSKAQVVKSRDTKFARCELEYKGITYWLTHIHPPLTGGDVRTPKDIINALTNNSTAYLNWKKYMNELANDKTRLLNRIPNKKLVIMGDFNTTSFNPTFDQNFGDMFNKKYSRISWSGKVDFLKLPIDHILPTQNLHNKINTQYLESNYSDHKAIKLYIK